MTGRGVSARQGLNLAWVADLNRDRSGDRAILRRVDDFNLKPPGHESRVYKRDLLPFRRRAAAGPGPAFVSRSS